MSERKLTLTESVIYLEWWGGPIWVCGHMQNFDCAVGANHKMAAMENGTGRI